MSTLQQEMQTVSDKLTVIDTELAALEALGPKGDGSKMYPHSVAAHTAAGEAGKALDRAVKLYQQQGQQQGGTQPPNTGDVGTGDVGNPVGHGPIPPKQLIDTNWSYYQQHNLGPKWAEIFSGTINEVNQCLGSNAGTIANSKPDPVVPGGYPSLATWG